MNNMPQVRLGTRGPMVSRLCFGTLTMGPLQKNLPVQKGAELILRACEKGVNFLDTAEYYKTYPYVKEALKHRRDLVVVSKSYAYDLDGAKRSIEMAQEGIGREYIDVFLMHEQESEHTFRGHQEAFDYYRLLQEKGVIGMVGISTHHIAATKAAAYWPGMDMVFPIINARGLGIADGTREEMEEAIQSAKKAGRFIMAMKALGGGHMISQRREAFDYIMSLRTVDAVAVGMQSEAEVDFNTALFSGMKPDEKASEMSMKADRRLSVEDWCEGCGKCVARCGQNALYLKDGKAAVIEEKCVRCGYCAGVCPGFCLKVI